MCLSPSLTCRFPTKLRNRHKVPAEPPSIFSAEIPLSCFSSLPPKPRTTTLSSSRARNPDVDEMSSHEEQYNVSSHTHPGFLSKFTQSISVLGKVAVSENQQDIILLSHSRKGPFLIILFVSPWYSMRVLHLEFCLMFTINLNNSLSPSSLLNLKPTQ